MKKILPLALLVAALAAALPSAPRAAASGVLTGRLGAVALTADASDADAIALAEQVLAANAEALGVRASDFAFTDVRRSNIGVHVRGAEVRGGVAVDGTSAAVHVVDGEVWKVEARGSALPGSAVAVAVPQRVAVGAAEAALGVTGATTHAERLLVAAGDHLVDTWRVDVLGLAEGVAGTVDVASADAAIVRVHDRRQFVDGTAVVFDPNPIQSSGDTTMAQDLDLLGVDSDTAVQDPSVDAERVALPMLDVDLTGLPAGKLRGPWVDVQGPAPMGVSPDFDGPKTDPRFEAFMVYAHLDRVQRYFQSLGFDDVNAEPQTAFALPVVGFDNSFYQPGNDLLLFGAGGVDDAEDAEVVLHEYGHATQDAQVPGWGSRHEGGSMGEGFGDFLAAAYYARTSGGVGDLCVADWDAVSYSSANPPCLRRMDSTKRYPQDMAGEVHDDGELWSAFLWRVRDRLLSEDEVEAYEAGELTDADVALMKSDRAIALVLTSHEFLSSTAEFGDAGEALLMAADALGHSEWRDGIVSAAAVTGMPTAP